MTVNDYRSIPRGGMQLRGFRPGLRRVATAQGPTLNVLMFVDLRFETLREIRSR